MPQPCIVPAFLVNVPCQSETTIGKRKRLTYCIEKLRILQQVSVPALQIKYCLPGSMY